MRLLSIETSCDETAISLVEINEEKTNLRVLADITISQIDVHIPYGGVFPALAKREHGRNLVPIFSKITESYSEIKIDIDENLLQEIHSVLEREKELGDFLVSFLRKNTVLPEVDAISVTYGPGLSPALWTGLNFAKALSKLYHVPLFPINHMEGHISSILLKENYLQEEEALFPLESFHFPMIALLISGGHTQLVLVKDWNDYALIGETLDDAVGEAFDKVARMLGMPYPGGPEISRKAKGGNKNEKIKLPRPMIHSNDYRFSFSGLKTAARYLIESLKKESKNGRLGEREIADISREFEHAVTDVLLAKTEQAIEEYGAKGLIIAGGVSANTFIRESFRNLVDEKGIKLYLPQKFICGDNALMIATTTFLKIKKGEEGLSPDSPVEVSANLSFSDREN